MLDIDPILSKHANIIQTKSEEVISALFLTFIYPN